MKILICLLVSVICGTSWAYSCPEDFETNKKKKAFHSWLQRFEGHLSMKGCEIEITLCNPNEGGDQHSMIGEIYVVDSHDREVYLPLNLVEKGNPKIRTSLEAHPRTLFYIKYDYYFEEEYGKTESYRLDIRLERKTGQIKSIDLGTYSTKKKVKSENGNESRWYNCGTRAW